MEVHHHTHGHHGKKTWKAYFWEFLMLFLAVFCGFLAEYKLEHVVEHQREKAFISSMIEDLEDDHNKLDRYVADLRTGLARMDTMITFLSDADALKGNEALLYYLGRVSPRIGIFTNNNRTLEQLKNSGSFRLIRKTAAANRIMAYYNDMNFIRALEGLYMQEFEDYKPLASGIFEPGVFRSMELPDGNISRETDKPVFQTNDHAMFKKLGVFAVYMNGSRRSILPACIQLQKTGDELAAFLKEEYHLK